MLVKVTLTTLALLAAAAGRSEAQAFSPWSLPVNLGPVVNSPAADLAPAISKDGLSLFFFSTRPGGFGRNDLWVAQRPAPDAPWGEPSNLGPTVNSIHDENVPALSPDGHTLYFVADGPGGFGGLDLWATRRRDKRDDFGWGAPENLGASVNSPFNDAGPSVFEDDVTGTLVLYFHSNRNGGGDDVFSSTRSARAESFDPAVFVPELSSPYADRIPVVTRDGLGIVVSSDRPGTLGGLDLWEARRSHVSDPWPAPEHLGGVLNSASVDGCGVLSFDGLTLYFQSARPGGSGGFDLYMSTRDKVEAAE